MAAPVLQLSNVTYAYAAKKGDAAVLALRSVSLQIQANERVGLIGPSGAGKSTLLSICNGLRLPTEGDVQVLGRSPHSLNNHQRRALQRQIGTVHQQHNLVTNLSVIHNVNAGHLGRWPLWKALWSLIWPQQVGVARQALAQLGIADKLYARTDKLSGGQQQRVALARVLVQNPAILLADEPVSSVDVARSHDIMKQLCEVGLNRTLLVSLHDVDLAQTYCDRIIGLRQGQIAFDLPASAVTKDQLSALYQLEAHAA